MNNCLDCKYCYKTSKKFNSREIRDTFSCYLKDKEKPLWEDVHFPYKNTNCKKFILDNNNFLIIIDELRKKREELGLTQRELAALINVDKLDIVRIEDFTVIPKMDVICRIIKALDLKIQVFI